MQPHKTERPHARERILDAAIRVVRDSGASNLTLESVAESAGVSKGGLLYHFPSKESLLKGLVDRYLESCQSRFEVARRARGEGPTASLQAYIQAVFEDDDIGLGQHGSLSLLAAVANDPQLLDELRRRMCAHYAEVGLRHPQPLEATRLMLAADGLMLLSIFGMDVLDAGQRQKLLDSLLDEADRLQRADR